MDGPDITKGFSDVDGQPAPAVLLDAMDATARWPAVQQLRAWEGKRLRFAPGLDLLDVGCGLGDVAIAMAAKNGGGRVVAVDVSEGMLSEARRRAASAGVQVDFGSADAQSLPFDDASFDRARSERTLQWLAEPCQAIAELIRVLRPGGRLTLVETDWRTMVMDHPDPALARRLTDAVAALRGPGWDIGGRMANLVREAGLLDLEVTAASHVWSAWDPATADGPEGLFPMRMMTDQLAAGGLLPPADADRFTDDLESAALRDRFFGSVTIVAVAARKPGSSGDGPVPAPTSGT